MTALPNTTTVVGLLLGSDPHIASEVVDIVRSLETQLSDAQRDLRAVRLGRDRMLVTMETEAALLNRPAVKEDDLDEQVTPVAIPPRPKPTKDDLKGFIAGALAGPIMEWLGGEADPYNDVEEIAVQVLEALDTEYRWNGANLAAWFKSEGWEIDMELAEILDEAEGIYRKLTDNAVRLWVAEHQVKNRFNIGDAVTYQNHPAQVTGVTETAHYIIYVPALGHVKEGHGVRGILVPFEEVET